MSAYVVIALLPTTDLLPQAEVFAIYLIMTLVLIVRPYGLLGHERLRKV